MDPRYAVRGYLRTIRDAWPAEQAERLGLVYLGPADFVLREGRWWTPRPAPRRYSRGAPRACYGNSIGGAVLYGLRYVQGYAISPVQPTLPIPHAWNADADGNVVDLTWNPVGLVYLGVELSVERADDATWNGDADPIDDYNRGWPLLRERWRGRDSAPASWEPSPMIRAFRAGLRGDKTEMRRWIDAADAEAGR